MEKIEKTDIKKSILPISVATLVGLVIGVVGLTIKYSDTLHSIDTRIIKIENQMNKGDRFTAQDGKILEHKILNLEKSKAEKSNLKVIEVKLANIETILLELKTKMK